MRLLALLLTLATVCSAMENPDTHKILMLDGEPLVLTVTQPSPTVRIVGLSYGQCQVYRESKAIRGHARHSYHGSLELESGYNESLSAREAKKIFISLAAKVKKTHLQ